VVASLPSHGPRSSVARLIGLQLPVAIILALLTILGLVGTMVFSGWLGNSCLLLALIPAVIGVWRLSLC
jgi:hypothetical protein